MEKAILERIKTHYPDLISYKVYQIGFKEDKSTSINASQLLNEDHGFIKRKMNKLIELQNANDSEDRVIIWKLLRKR
jgi:hypothetical protein